MKNKETILASMQASADYILNMVEDIENGAVEDVPGTLENMSLMFANDYKEFAAYWKKLEE